MEKTKECKKCKKQLSTKDFPKDSRSKDKLWRFCRACESARKKAQREKNKANKPQTKPQTKTKSKKGSSKKVSLKVFFRTKCSMTDNALGHYVCRTNKITGKVNKHISIFLPRLIRGAQLSPHSFTGLFSEAISHEHIHALLHEHEGIDATNGLDNLFGKVRNHSEIGIGLSK